MNRQKKLNLARNKIDLLDKKIFDLIKKRTKVVKHMILLKQSRKQIVDTKRIKKILLNIKKKSIKNKIDPKITSQIWKSIIWAYVKYQRRNFRKK
jgi:chorismate mutase